MTISFGFSMQGWVCRDANFLRYIGEARGEVDCDCAAVEEGVFGCHCVVMLSVLDKGCGGLDYEKCTI